MSLTPGRQWGCRRLFSARIPSTLAPLSRAGLARQQATTAHTGLAFLAFFSDLTASSWAFRFSASLLACEDRAAGPAVMGGSGQRDSPLYVRPPLLSRASSGEVNGSRHGENKSLWTTRGGNKPSLTFAFQTSLPRAAARQEGPRPPLPLGKLGPHKSVLGAAGRGQTGAAFPGAIWGCLSQNPQADLPTQPLYS